MIVKSSILIVDNVRYNINVFTMVYSNSNTSMSLVAKGEEVVDVGDASSYGQDTRWRCSLLWWTFTALRDPVRQAR